MADICVPQLVWENLHFLSFLLHVSKNLYCNYDGLNSELVPAAQPLPTIESYKQFSKHRMINDSSVWGCWERDSGSWQMHLKRLVSRGWSGLRKQNPSLISVKAADNCFCTQRLFLNMRKLTTANCSSVFPLPLATNTIFLPLVKRKSGSRKQIKSQPYFM